MFSPLVDAGAAGSLANATMCPQFEPDASEPEASEFSSSPAPAPTPACAARPRRGLARLAAALLGPISGPQSESRVDSLV